MKRVLFLLPLIVSVPAFAQMAPKLTASEQAYEAQIAQQQQQAHNMLTMIISLQEKISTLQAQIDAKTPEPPTPKP